MSLITDELEHVAERTVGIAQQVESLSWQRVSSTSSCEGAVGAATSELAAVLAEVNSHFARRLTDIAADTHSYVAAVRRSDESAAESIAGIR